MIELANHSISFTTNGSSNDEKSPDKSRKRKRSVSESKDKISVSQENIVTVKEHVLKIIENTTWPTVSVEQVGATLGLSKVVVSKGWKAVNNNGQIPIKYWKWFFVYYDSSFLSDITNVYNLSILGNQTYEQFIGSLWLKVKEVIEKVSSNEFTPYTPSSHTIQTAETSLNMELTKKITSLFLEIIKIPSLESSQFNKKVTEWLDRFPEEKIDKAKIAKKIFEMKEAVTLSQMQNDINLGSTQVISKIEDLLREFQVFDKQIDLKKTSELIADVIYFRQFFTNTTMNVELPFQKIARLRITKRYKLWNKTQRAVAFLFNINASTLSKDWTQAYNYDPNKKSFNRKNLIKYRWAALDKSSVMCFLEKKFLPMYVMMEGKTPLDFMRDIQQLLDNSTTTKYQDYIDYLVRRQRKEVPDLMSFSSHFDKIETVSESVSTVDSGDTFASMEVEIEEKETENPVAVAPGEISDSNIEKQESDVNNSAAKKTSRHRKRARAKKHCAKSTKNGGRSFLEMVHGFIEADRLKARTTPTPETSGL